MVAVFGENQVEQQVWVPQNPIRRNSVQAFAACRYVNEAPVFISEAVIHLIDHPEREIVRESADLRLAFAQHFIGPAPLAAVPEADADPGRREEKTAQLDLASRLAVTTSMRVVAGTAAPCIVSKQRSRSAVLRCGKMSQSTRPRRLL